MSHARDRAAEAGQRAREAEDEWIRALERCRCVRAVRGRTYLDARVCERCLKLVDDES